ncbi:MAG: aldehyde:ferredoxin oxidoreductase, partial [Candidatus Lokiarchaeota archaeon]|nr:aldehyde:ferredoxin oxidoreductase [Candidatus Lokiarchaeota archaeon]
KALGLSGITVTPADLDRIGAEIYKNKYAFKFREGFTIDPASIPKRIFETPSPVNYLTEPYVARALAHFEKIIKQP